MPITSRRVGSAQMHGNRLQSLPLLGITHHCGAGTDTHSAGPISRPATTRASDSCRVDTAVCWQLLEAAELASCAHKKRVTLALAIVRYRAQRSTDNDTRTQACVVSSAFLPPACTLLNTSDAVQNERPLINLPQPSQESRLSSHGTNVSVSDLAVSVSVTPPSLA